MLDRTFYVLRHRVSQEVLPAQDRTGNITSKPALYIDRRRAKQGRTNRTEDIADPNEWDLVPVRLVECEQSEVGD